MIERIAYHWLAQGAGDDLNVLAEVVARFEWMGTLGVPSPDVELALAGEETS